MAGYDFTFSVASTLHPEATLWLRFAQRLSRIRGLELHYRCAKRTLRHAEFYVRVDGPLPEMQRLQRQLPEYYLPYVLGRNGPTKTAVKVISRYITENGVGVARITNVVFDLARQLESSPSRLSFSPKVMIRAGLERARMPEDRVVKGLVGTIDGWLSDRLSNEQTLIACDQAMENWLKVRLALPATDRSHFPALLSQAIQASHLTRTEGHRLSIYHRSRNRVQHRSGKVKRETVRQMLEFVVSLVNERC